MIDKDIINIDAIIDKISEGEQFIVGNKMVKAVSSLDLTCCNCCFLESCPRDHIPGRISPSDLCHMLDTEFKSYYFVETYMVLSDIKILDEKIYMLIHGMPFIYKGEILVVEKTVYSKGCSSCIQCDLYEKCSSRTKTDYFYIDFCSLMDGNYQMVSQEPETFHLRYAKNV